MVLITREEDFFEHDFLRKQVRLTGKMEANELYSLAVSPIVTNPFSIEWSQDNHLSLITQRGVHVFELVPHPMCISPMFRFWRTFVYPSEFMPAESFEKFVNSVIWKMTREEVCTLLMQPSITPKVEDKTDLEPRIISVAWSPKKLVDTWGCLLAILTSSGSIEILYKLGNNWLSVWNLSSIWCEKVKDESGLDPETVNEKDFDQISWPEHINRLICTAITWSSLFHDSDDSRFAYFVSVFRSCELVVFRVDPISDLLNMKQPTVVYKTKLKNSAKITTLLWVDLENDKHIIFIGSIDGRINALRFTIENGIFGGEKFFEYHNHADRIIPSSIKLMHKYNEHRIILVTKGSWLLALNIDENGECTKTRHLRIGDSFITGLTAVTSDKVIVSTQFSKLFVVTVSESKELSCEPLKNNLRTKKVQYLGTASSPNATILLNVTSPDAMHDHLINREPTTIQIFNILGEDWNPWRIINTKIDADVSLYEYWDCLESIRVKAARSLDPPKELPEIPRLMNGLSIHKLRMVMWLTLISQVLEKKQMLKGVEKIVGEISEAQPLIFLLSACKHLQRIAKKSNLTADEKRCISFLRMYMEIYIAGEEDEEISNSVISREVNEALSATSHVDSIETESCNLCGDVISVLPWTIESCPGGHRLSRCSITLLQITSMDYRICPICGRMFHPSLDDEYQEIRCLYCDVPVQYDIRMITNKLGDVESRWKNLSKRPASISEGKLQENENCNAGPLPINEKSKRRGMNPHTFAVIVNKDDDDSCITETWQEF